MRPWLLLYPISLVLSLRSWTSVFTDTGVFPRGTDSYYHLWRIKFVLENFPVVPDYDRYLNFPEGGIVRWPYGFDLIYATLAKIMLIGNQDEWALWAVCSLLTSVLWAVVPCLAYYCGERLAGRPVGYAVGLLLAFFTCDYNSVGYVDHHYMEALWTAAYLLCYLNAIFHKRYVLWSMLAGAAFTCGLLCTTTLPLMLVLHFISAAMVAFLLKEARIQIIRINSLLSLSIVVTLLLFAVTRFFEKHGPNPALTTSWLVTWLVAGACVLFRVALKDRPSLAQVTVLIIAIVFFPLVDWKEVLGFAVYGVLHVNRVDPWLASIQESQSMLFVGLDFVVRVYSWLWVFWPVLVGYALWIAWRRSDAGMLSCVILGLLATPAAVLQMKFLLFIAVPYVLVTAVVMKEFFSLVWSKAELGNVWFRLFRIALLVALPIAFWPMISKLTVKASVVVPDGRFQALYPTIRWINNNTPRTSRYGDATTDYAIAAHWGIGHWMVAIGQRPVIGSPLGGPEVNLRESIRKGSEMLFLPPVEAERLIRHRRARYVLVSLQPLTTTLRLAYWDCFSGRFLVDLSKYDEQQLLNQSLFMALFNDGLPSGTAEDKAALRHFRLVHESPEGLFYPGTDKPFAMLFEHVEGAVLTGLAAAGSTVSISVEVETPRRKFVYRDSVQADTSGRFVVTVPYATGQHKYSEVKAGRYLVRSNNATAMVTVTDDQVRSGETVVVW
ncbi:MAG: hypothetical protein RMM17_02020 [Acidobacteriota bacterium]|nr:hypothetical protein [Blastocatellia bacterium]MDW8411447.1 hypothetical protein [Acidobacteriota bacterium]